MKKLTKTLLGAVLSVAMVVTGGLAALGYTPVTTKAAEATVALTNLARNVVASEGATVVLGSKASATTYVDATHKGLVLSGGQGATFNLGTINITNSFWNEGEADPYMAVPEAASPFISFSPTTAIRHTALRISSSPRDGQP